MTAPAMDERDVKKDLDNALNAMKLAHPEYDKAQQKYEGDSPEVFASPRMRRALRTSGINYQMRYGAVVVNSVADRCEIASITANDNSDASDADAAIQTVFERNKLELQAPNIIRKACTYGDAYAIVWPRENVEEVDGKYKPEDLAIWYQDPRTVRVFYSADNPNEIDYAVKRWVEDDNTRVDLYYSDRIESYVAKGKSKGKKATDFIPTSGTGKDDSDQDADDDNPVHITYHNFGKVPVFHFKTDADQYGEPEHKGFYSTSDVLHKLVIGHMAGVDYQAYPQRYALLNDQTDSSEAARLDEGQFSYKNDGSGTTEDYGLEARSEYRADPGSVWMMKGVNGVGQFDTADSKNFTDPAAFYLRCGATITNTPLHYFDPSGDTPSGESLKTAEAPFVKKVKTRQASFGDTWRELFQFVLKLCGYGDINVLVRWEPAESVDEESVWTTAKAKQEAGVPWKQTILEGGYTDSQVEEWEEDREANLPQKVALLLQVAEATGAFAPAVAAGVITSEQVNAIIANLIGDVTDDDVEPVATPTATDDPESSGTAVDPTPRRTSSGSGDDADSSDSGTAGL